MIILSISIINILVRNTNRFGLRDKLFRKSSNCLKGLVVANESIPGSQITYKGQVAVHRV